MHKNSYKKAEKDNLGRSQGPGSSSLGGTGSQSAEMCIRDRSTSSRRLSVRYPSGVTPAEGDLAACACSALIWATCLAVSSRCLLYTSHSLRSATLPMSTLFDHMKVSIHALLAECDIISFIAKKGNWILIYLISFSFIYAK